MVEDDSSASQTYELYGPKNYSMAEISELVDREIIKKRRHVNIPKVLLKPMANLINKVTWWNTTSGDGIEREFIDQIIDPHAKTFKDLGINPGEISNFTFHYLVSNSSTVMFISEARLMEFTTCSKDIEARRSMTYLLQPNGKRGRKRSIYMSLMINSLRLGLGGVAF